MSTTLRTIGARQKKYIAYCSGGKCEDGWEGQHWCCNMCKQFLDPGYEIDHIDALMFGGENSPENCQALCSRCHASKTTQDHIERDRRKRELQKKSKRVCGICNITYSTYFKHDCTTAKMAIQDFAYRK